MKYLDGINTCEDECKFRIGKKSIKFKFSYKIFYDKCLFMSFFHHFGVVLYEKRMKTIYFG